tara:strand:- start:1091 stop:1648 length:558 start_codon:yes stop_codon:yes gene_type:complete
MLLQKISGIPILLAIVGFILSSCAALPGADARKYPPSPEKRVKKNIEEGRGFRLSDSFSGGSGTFEFASSNPLWRATLDSISFMPLAAVNYGGGVIITDWYSTNDTNESIKISIRFLTNEIRSDALDIKIFSRECKTASNCIISEKPDKIVPELKLKILRIASIYSKQQKVKNFKPYTGFDNERD